MANWSYQVLCDDDAMETYLELTASKDLARDLETKLDKVTQFSDYRTSVEWLAAALVAYAETDVSAYNLLDLDLEDPEDKAKFEAEYDPFLDQVYNTDLSRLKKKAAKTLRSLPDTKLGALRKAYDDTYDDWTGNIDEMLEELYKK